MAPATDHTSPAQGGPTILVAEDEVLIRYDISEYLRGRGYNVVEANSAAEAIQILKSAIPVSIVFTDVRMPGTVDGIDLAKYVQRHHPGIPVLVTSGHIDPAHLPPGLGPLIDKPYKPIEILSAIEQHLQKQARKKGP